LGLIYLNEIEQDDKKGSSQQGDSGLRSIFLENYTSTSLFGKQSISYKISDFYEPS
jgi:hypothetical protein